MANTWQYSDWITLTDRAARLARLRLHIQEVSEHTMGAQIRGRSYFPVDPNYIASLNKQEAALSSEVESTAPSIARTKARFPRG